MPCFSGHTGLEDRAAVVLIQSLYETKRFASVKAELGGFFGRLSLVPVNALLLYLSLALDFPEARAEAQGLTVELLQSRAPQGGEAGWSRRQYAALLHLYVFEMLLPELWEPSQAIRWLEESSLPIPASLRSSMVTELMDTCERLEEEREEGVRELRRNSTARAVVPQGNPAASLLLGTSLLRPLKSGRSDAMVIGDEPDLVGLHSDTSASVSPESASASESEDEGEGAFTSGPSARAWSKSWRDASSALGSIPNFRIFSDDDDRSKDDGGGDATAPPYDAGQVLVGGLLVALVGYVAVHRRRQVAAGAQSALRALGDVLRMGLQLSPSSMPRGS